MYFFEVLNKATNEIIARVNGDIETVGYVARKVAFNVDADYAVMLHAVDTIGGDVTANLLTLEADGEVAALMLKKKITAARKALAAPAAE